MLPSHHYSPQKSHSQAKMEKKKEGEFSVLIMNCNRASLGFIYF